MNRKAYKLPFTEKGLLRWMCTSCGKGLLRIKKDTFHAEETKDSKRVPRYEAWNPDQIEYVYSCLLECTILACKDTVANSGTGWVVKTLKSHIKTLCLNRPLTVQGNYSSMKLPRKGRKPQGNQ